MSGDYEERIHIHTSSVLECFVVHSAPPNFLPGSSSFKLQWVLSGSATHPFLFEHDFRLARRRF